MHRRYLVVIKPQAIADIEDAAAFIEEQSGDSCVADLWETAAYEQIKHLETFPNSYPRFSRRKYRHITYGRYLIVYRVDDVELKVVVCRVVSAWRDRQRIGPMESD
ncbi:MAG: type II toxin-antitoxin system RelE/ParE family toxin [Planctomycetota bacterium]|nr:type II toxin-antitoxin system RelE/ParE family toxin [Planctomycetota bacterium]